MVRYSAKTLVVVVGAVLLFSGNVAVVAEGEAAQAVVTESGEVEVEAPECANPNADGSCPNPEAEAEAEVVTDATPDAEEAVAEEEVAPEEEKTPEEPDAKESEPEEEKQPEDPSCPSRPHIIRCAAAYLDKNKNDKLEREELQTAIDALPWLSRGVLKILGSVDKIMQKCDADGDDAIGMYDDMEKTKEQCLASCFKRKAFKSAFFNDCDL